jgi:uncharacterized membrane protein YphA (DoxX/SURF4 family)
MKFAPTIAGLLLGLAFMAFGLDFFYNFLPKPESAAPPPEAAQKFFAALTSTDYLKMVKILEIAGGLLVAIPLTRNIGLLVLGPILVNILATHIFLFKCQKILDPALIGICVLASYLLWCGRRKFLGLLG